ncbi:hypothetical protein K439DRAFT_1630348 [Ramaria rubella]|nr:hypothetical protein K439DRAFT_1630348 [Ramaria rubella]
MAIRESPAVFDGPVELVQAIFDTAARNEKSTALTLIRVCRTARRWVIPILYETVELDNPAALRFERMLALPSAPSLLSCVRNLRVTCMPNIDLLEDRCSQVQTMTLANYDLNHLERLPLPSLTCLTVEGSLRYSRLSSKMASLAHVTHLRFTNDVPRLPEDFASAMPKLTHFSCCYHLSKKPQDRGLEQCLSAVLAAPSIRAVVVYVHSREGARDAKALDSLTHIQGLDDPRVVVASSVELPDVCHPCTTSWTLAARKLKTRPS